MIELNSTAQEKRMPGAIRQQRIAARATCVRFAPTGRAWAATTPEGLLVYSLDGLELFDPVDLDVEITPAAMEAALAEGDYATAMLVCCRFCTVLHVS